MDNAQSFPRIAVSVAAQDPATGRFLLVRRGRPPAADLWAFPGGRVQFGETLKAAAERELLEETGLRCDMIRFHTLVELIGDDTQNEPPHHFVLAVYLATTSGNPVAADDAVDAGWFDVGTMASLAITDSTLEVAQAIARAG